MCLHGGGVGGGAKARADPATGLRPLLSRAAVAHLMPDAAAAAGERGGAERGAERGGAEPRGGAGLASPNAKAYAFDCLARARAAHARGDARAALLLLTQAHSRDAAMAEPLLMRARVYAGLGLHAQARVIARAFASALSERES